MPEIQSVRLGKPTKKLTTGVVAELLGISPQTVRGMCERGDFPGARLIGTWWRIPAESVRPYMDDGGEAK